MPQPETGSTSVPEPQPSPKADWRATLSKAYGLLRLAHTYADDGAWLTAADRAEEAARLLREAHALRTAAMDAAVQPEED